MADGSYSSPKLTEELRRHCQARRAALLTERQPYEADWKQVADYIDPYAGRYLQNARSTNKLPSRSKIINSAASKACRDMDAGFMGGFTSKARPWFRVAVPNPQLAELTNVKAWTDDLGQRQRDVLERSNFYTALPNFYHSRHLFGIAALGCMPDEEEVLRFHVFPVGTYAVGLDRRGRCDSFWHNFNRTARQLEQKYGRTNLPLTVTQALDNNKRDQQFVVESLIEPNPEGEKDGYCGRTKRPFRQILWIQGAEADTHGCLHWGGFYHNPVLVSRWNALEGDIYSTSPAIEALGDIKQLQYLEGEKLRLIDLSSKPPLALPESLRNRGASLEPGSRTYITPAQTQATVAPIYTPDPRSLMQVQEEIKVVRERVDEAFYVDLFRMLDFLDDRTRTAYEVSERKEEKVAMLGPALESLTDEVFDPVIELLFSAMQEMGLLPEPPAELDRVPLRIEYTSMLAQAQKALGTGTIERVIQFALGLASVNPAVLDKLDLDQAVDEVSERQGAPARIVRSDDDVAEIRAGRAQQAQMAQAAQMAPAMKQGADALKVLGETVPKEGSMVSSLGEAMG